MKRFLYIFTAVLLCLTLTSCRPFIDSVEYTVNNSEFLLELQDILEQAIGYAENGEDYYIENTAETGTLDVWYIDVGQGDSILIMNSERMTMLIDSGEYDKADTLKDFLREKGIKRLDYIVVTHPHTDHMGSMADIINSFDVGAVYMPKVSSDTRSYEALLNSIKRKGLKINVAKAGVNIDFGSVKTEILAPVSDYYDEVNNFSAVIKMTYGDNKLIFTGDAEVFSEAEMITRGTDIEADVIKIGHHGSSTSTSDYFIREVEPICAVISVGKDNDYGHPANSVLKRLGNIPVLRTDKLGSIHIFSDGVNIFADSEKEPKTVLIGRKLKDTDIVYASKKGTKYHGKKCPYYNTDFETLTRAEAEAKGYERCTKCNP